MASSRITFMQLLPEYCGALEMTFCRLGSCCGSHLGRIVKTKFGDMLWFAVLGNRKVFRFQVGYRLPLIVGGHHIQDDQSRCGTENAALRMKSGGHVLIFGRRVLGKQKTGTE